MNGYEPDTQITRGEKAGRAWQRAGSEVLGFVVLFPLIVVVSVVLGARFGVVAGIGSYLVLILGGTVVNLVRSLRAIRQDFRDELAVEGVGGELW